MSKIKNFISLIKCFCTPNLFCSLAQVIGLFICMLGEFLLLIAIAVYIIGGMDTIYAAIDHLTFSSDSWFMSILIWVLVIALIRGTIIVIAKKKLDFLFKNEK